MIIRRLQALFERTLGPADDASAAPPSPDDHARHVAGLAARLDGAAEAAELADTPEDSAALLAAYLDGGLDDRATAVVHDRLVRSSSTRHDAEAAAALLDAIEAQPSAAPTDLVAAALAPSPRTPVRRPVRWPWWLAVLFAAATAAVVAGLLLTRPVPDPTDAKAPLVATPTPLTEVPRSVPVGDQSSTPEAKPASPRMVPAGSLETVPAHRP